MNTKIFKLVVSFVLAISSIALYAANYTISTAANIDLQCYAVGDTVTVADATASEVLGDGIATLADGVITMKHTGVTLLKSTSGTEYIFAVYETPAAGGDVFFHEFAQNVNINWESDAWIKLTSNSDRTYPNHADDVAILINRASTYRYVNITGDGVTIGQLIRADASPFTIAQKEGATRYLRFARTDGIAPRVSICYPVAGGVGNVQSRMGEHDRNDGENVLAISFEGPELEFDWCGDSPLASSSYCRTMAVAGCLGRSSITVDKGQTLILKGGSRKTLQGQIDNFYLHERVGSGLFGEGTVEIRDVSANLSNGENTFKPSTCRIITGFDKNGVDSNTTCFSTGFNTIPSDVNVEVLSGFCSTNVTPYVIFKSYWNVGVPNAILSKSILLSGTVYQLNINGAYAPDWDYYLATNIAEKLTIRGHVAFYTNPSYSRDNGHLTADGVQQGRVTQSLRIKNFDRYDPWSTAMFYGFNFCRGASNTNDIKGVVYMDNWEEHIIRPEGVEPSEYNHTVYPIIPWMMVHCNDNSQTYSDSDWGQEQTFPGIREEDGSIRLILSQNNCGDQTLSNRGENDNFYYISKNGLHLNGADRRIFSLVHSTGETPNYAAGGNFYLDTSKGGHKLYITSGCMAVIRNSRWVGQPVDMTRNGGIVLEGNPSYLFGTAGIISHNTGTSDTDYNMIWVPLTAANSLVKGGAGSLGIAGDQRGIKGTLVINGGELFLGYPSYKKNGLLYNVKNPVDGWPMHGAATDCDFRVRGGAVLALSSPGYTGVDSDGNEVDEPVIAHGAGAKHSIVLERSGETVGSLYIAEGVAATIYEMATENYGEEAVSLERGVWGSSESDAELVDDTLFAGKGTIKVLHDRLVRPTIVLVK